MKYGRKANLSTKSCSEISELEDNKRNCSERKKLLEMEKVAGNRRSCQKVAKQLVGSPRSLGGGGGGSNKVYYGECASYEFVLIPLDFASLFKSGFQ